MVTKTIAKRIPPRLLLLAPGSWIHGKRALRAALGSGFDIFFVDSCDPNLYGSGNYTFIKLPRSGYGLYKHVLSDSYSRRLRDRIYTAWFAHLRNRIRPDLVHVCWIDFRAALCSRAGLDPLILSAWGTDVNAHLEPGSDPVWRAFAVEAMSKAALTIVDAPGIKTRCEMLVGRQLRTEMLHLGVDTDEFRGGLRSERSGLRMRLEIDDNAVLLSSMRALSPLYNHEVILEAFARTLPNIRRKAYLLFKAFNAQAGYLEVLKQKTQQYGIGEFVKFVGEIPTQSLPSLYAATDFVINCPCRDSLPVTLLEAAACQRAVLSNRLETYTSLPDGNITWIPTNNTTDLSTIMTRSINEYQYRDSAYPEVRSAIVAEFSEQRYRGGVRSIYQRVAGGE